MKRWQRVLKFASGIYLLHCMFFYRGSYSTIQIKKSLLNQPIPWKIKSFVRKEKIGKKLLSIKPSKYCIPEILGILLPRGERMFNSSGTVWICLFCRESATLERFFKMLTLDHWNWPNTPETASGNSQRDEMRSDFYSLPGWLILGAVVTFVLSFLWAFIVIKSNFFSLILFMKSGRGLLANQRFQCYFYFI